MTSKRQIRALSSEALKAIVKGTATLDLIALASAELSRRRQLGRIQFASAGNGIVRTRNPITANDLRLRAELKRQGNDATRKR